MYEIQEVKIRRLSNEQGVESEKGGDFKDDFETFVF